MNSLSALETITKKCSRCGTCQAHCPIYKVTGLEPFVARGKVELLDRLQDQSLDLNAKIADIFSVCLLCGSCTEFCPNGVEVDRAVRTARNILVESLGMSLIKRTIFHHFLCKDGRLNVAAKLLVFYQMSGMQKLVRNSRILNVLPGELASREKLLPFLPPRHFDRLIKTPNSSEKIGKLRVAYFVGCMTNYVYPKVGLSILKILQAKSIQIIIPKVVCCGAPALANGDYETARVLARKNLEALSASEVDYVITDCGSCLTTLLEYTELFQGQENTRLLSNKLVDITTFLVEHGLAEFPGRVNLGRITYHDPCHLKRLPGGRTSSRILLKALNGAEFVEMKGADKCCGCAGSFNLSHYKLSQKVVQPKIEDIRLSKANVVATGCPACIMQLQHASANADLDVKVVHTVELLAQALE